MLPTFWYLVRTTHCARRRADGLLCQGFQQREGVN